MNHKSGRAPLYHDADARKRIAHLCDAHSFIEWLPPSDHLTSPHLIALNVPVEFDDGVVIGSGRISGKEVFCAAQQGGFIGGAVGEVHGAKITGLLERAGSGKPVPPRGSPGDTPAGKPAACIFLIDSGGVRLHEANAGLIAVSEMLRALLDLRSEGVPCIALVGGKEGAFGGMGIFAKCCDYVVMSENGRLGMSGPGVIEDVMGVEEFDAGDRAMIWRTYGGKHRYLLRECDDFVEDSVDAFRGAAITRMGTPRPITCEGLMQEQRELEKRWSAFGMCRDAVELWRMLGVERPEEVQSLPSEEFLHAAAVRDQGFPDTAALKETSAKPMKPPGILGLLFPRGNECVVRKNVITGHAHVGGETVSVIGTTNHATIDIGMCLRLADHVLDTVESHPGRPMVMLVDCAGQELSRRAELLGINGYFAHLIKCLHLARRRGHHLISIVYGKAISGAFLSFGLIADQIYGLPGAEVGVMKLSAMSRVTRIPERRLRQLGETSPVFAPGIENFMRLGGIREIWQEGDLAEKVAAALKVAERADTRRELGYERKGRLLAHVVAERVKSA